MTEMDVIVFASGERAWCWPLPPDPIVLHTTELRSADLIEQFNVWQTLTGARFHVAEVHRLLDGVPVA